LSSPHKQAFDPRELSDGKIGKVFAEVLTGNPKDSSQIYSQGGVRIGRVDVALRILDICNYHDAEFLFAALASDDLKVDLRTSFA